ncbi:MAG: isocitrate/isopropylmalate family dehydrogenase, partial [Oscillospiraceae bacterium]
METIDSGKNKFAELIELQKKRVAKMQSEGDFIDYQTLSPLVIGICGGDGIGPVITREAERVLRFLLEDEVQKGKVTFKEIDGLTIENRAKVGKAIPDDVLAELKSCQVILKGPTTTPRAGDEWPNIESANVAMRKELDLFANVRPVKVPEQGIDWTFFRENTEGAYAVGSLGFETEAGISVDFTITTTDGTERIAELAYDFAEKNKKKRVSIVTKANVIKATDGKFLRICQEIGAKHPNIVTDDWYIDIMTAKLVDEKRRRDFEV